MKESHKKGQTSEKSHKKWQISENKSQTSKRKWQKVTNYWKSYKLLVTKKSQTSEKKVTNLRKKSDKKSQTN